jgi:hypothetical protein
MIIIYIIMIIYNNDNIIIITLNQKIRCYSTPLASISGNTALLPLTSAHPFQWSEAHQEHPQSVSTIIHTYILTYIHIHTYTYIHTYNNILYI